MSPADALDRVVYLKDRALEESRRIAAYAKAREIVLELGDDEIARRHADGSLQDVPGIGPSTAKVIALALDGGIDEHLADLEATTAIPLAEGAELRAALRGDCHSHTVWSDGGASAETMARTAMALGHQYLVITDHSPRLTIAHGLDRERLLQQLDEIDQLNAALAPFRILTGIEVDILEDGTLDHGDAVLSQLDVVVASVHSKLRMGGQEMTERMVRAVANPNVDILGHCTGRLIGKRDPSSFDPDYVFAACAQFHTAVEINCRPERLDPPRPLLQMAIEYGCYFAINSDAHATGQLEWQPHGCNRAAEVGVPLDRVLNSWPLEQLLAWVAGDELPFG